MDIAALSMALSNQNLSSAVNVAVMKLHMDNVEQLNTTVIEDLKSMELSVNPNRGSNIDIHI